MIKVSVYICVCVSLLLGALLPSQTAIELVRVLPPVHPGCFLSLSLSVCVRMQFHTQHSLYCISTNATTTTTTTNPTAVVRVGKSLEAKFSDSRTMAKEEAGDVIEDCQTEAYRMLEQADGNAKKSTAAIEFLASCVEKGVARKLEKANEEIAFQARIRTDMAGLLENYTCVDDTVMETPDVSTKEWNHKGVARTVHVKHDRPASQIHMIENFIAEDECQAMADAAAPTLHSATVADGKGGSRLSENRKAKQAGIKVPWDKEKDDNPIARLSRRVYDYTNHVLDLNIDEFGQEDLMSIQYFGRGRNDTAPDRYTPHCDGDCTGLPHKSGTRMATVVMYCTLPSDGGSTNFRNAGVHIKPVEGGAVFFSYINPKTMITDTGFTEHSGCPVFEGEKKIVTQWIRYGVDTENPWDSFNTRESVLVRSGSVVVCFAAGVCVDAVSFFAVEKMLVSLKHILVLRSAPCPSFLLALACLSSRNQAHGCCQPVECKANVHRCVHAWQGLGRRWFHKSTRRKREIDISSRDRSHSSRVRTTFIM